MKNTLKLASVALITTFILGACQSNAKKESTHTLPEGTHEVTALEIIPTDSYTYVRVKEGEVENWIAIPLSDVKIGETYYYDGGLEMKDFESKSLQRMFPSIYFVQAIRTQPIVIKDLAAAEKQTKPSETVRKTSTMEQAAGGVTIEELYKNSASFADQSVIVKGEVVKVNNGIMGVNWVHLQDGTSHNDDFDLTITTNATVNVGEIATFKGVVHLKKDFGSGYFYEVIVEEATHIQ